MLATAKPADVGTLYRCKAVLAQLGSTQRLAFHAVSDVTEQEDVGPWLPSARSEPWPRPPPKSLAYTHVWLTHTTCAPQPGVAHIAGIIHQKRTLSHFVTCSQAKAAPFSLVDHLETAPLPRSGLQDCFHRQEPQARVV